MSRFKVTTSLIAGVLLVTCAQQGSLESSEEGIVGFEDFSKGTDKSFGMFVCATGGEVTLTGVEAMSVEGGIELLGGYVFVASEGFLTAVDGFPPTGLDEDAYEPIAGAKVLTDCAEEDPEVKTQLIVGAGRSESEGGRIEGIRILYEGGSLEIPDYSIVLCGDEMEHCEDLGLDG